MKRLIIILFCIVAAVAAFEIGWGIYLSQTTGMLVASSTDSAATLTLSQTNHKQLTIGTGKARIRLHPGTYQITATHDAAQVSKTFQIYKKQTTTETLQLNTAQQNQQSWKTSQDNQLIKYLPYTPITDDYRVSYSYVVKGSTAQPTIIITAPTQAGYDNAIKWIKFMGFNPSDLDIQQVTAAL